MLKRIGIFFFCLIGAVAAAAVSGPSLTAQAEDIYPGDYSVTVVSTYQNPVTGEVEDSGQNPSIGQMMVQAQVQSVGYVSIEEDGTIWLNTRWNQADANIYASFATSASGSGDWITRDYEVTSQVEAGEYEYLGNVFAATVTDYRFQLETLDDVVRCSNYVEAMGRECVWFCYIADLVEYDGSWGTIETPDMGSYTDQLSEIAGETEEESSDDTSGSGSTGTSSGTSTNKSASAASASKSGETDKKTTPKISEREVAEAKTADDLLDTSDGISGVEDETDDTVQASASVSSGTIVFAVIGGLILGGAVVGAVMHMNQRKRRKYTDLFADVDDKADGSDHNEKE